MALFQFSYFVWYDVKISILLYFLYESTLYIYINKKFFNNISYPSINYSDMFLFISIHPFIVTFNNYHVLSIIFLLLNVHIHLLNLNSLLPNSAFNHYYLEHFLIKLSIRLFLINFIKTFLFKHLMFNVNLILLSIIIYVLIFNFPITLPIYLFIKFFIHYFFMLFLLYLFPSPILYSIHLNFLIIV